MKLVIGNLKMNLTSNEIDDYLAYFKDSHYKNVVFVPSSLYLERFIRNKLMTGAQDVSFSESGAFTGDISANQLQSIGVSYAIVGHSERRKYHDDSKYVSQKLACLFNHHITPILCVGETKEEHTNNMVEHVLKKELDNALKTIDKTKLHDIIIAYEPIWSIGTGLIPTNCEIEKVISCIKEYLFNNYGIKPRILYGGSVNNDCLDELEKITIIDGYLVGGCSIKKEEFKKLISRLQ